MDNPFQVLIDHLIRLEQKVDQLSAKKPDVIHQAESNDDLLTTHGLADLLGISISTVYQKIHNKELPFCKPAGTKRVYFSKKVILEFIATGRVKTNAEVEQEAEVAVNERCGKNKKR